MLVCDCLQIFSLEDTLCNVFLNGMSKFALRRKKAILWFHCKYEVHLPYSRFHPISLSWKSCLSNNGSVFAEISFFSCLPAMTWHWYIGACQRQNLPDKYAGMCECWPADITFVLSFSVCSTWVNKHVSQIIEMIRTAIQLYISIFGNSDRYVCVCLSMILAFIWSKIQLKSNIGKYY